MENLGIGTARRSDAAYRQITLLTSRTDGRPYADLVNSLRI